ncbi:hypothetical protein GCM10009678_92230 [Actinomadura kijaniata]|uniref:Secreted protein n=1 Tax=Actinomadura namibiensis TaxID=182080 RepID=A0A7W3M057_ACTNM|nr:hypothetical protein [Actinomadura namibiensis]MBA8957427.1 hypothetical protein [Actinomadura namibiensis]
MRTTLANRAGLLGVAAATTLALAPVPAHAAPATLTPAVAQPGAAVQPGADAAAAKWRTIQHKSKLTKVMGSKNWKRKRHVRVIQVNARCWGNDTRLTVELQYKRRAALGWAVAKKGRWNCDGRYRTVRIHNAGHSEYRVFLSVGRKHTIEFWFQYYG